MTTTTARSLDLLRAAGYMADVTERHIPYARIKRDLFTIGDIFAIKAGEAAIVQTTSKDHLAERIRKIRACEAFDTILASGLKIYAHGWYQQPNRRWACEVREITE